MPTASNDKKPRPIGGEFAAMDAVKSWQTVWRDVNLATFDPRINTPYGAILDGAVALQNDEIVWVGLTADIPQWLPPETQVFSGEGKWFTPGLIDCHTHMVFAGNRADEFEKRLHGIDYASIAKQGGGILSTVAKTRVASHKELLLSARERINWLQREGVTHIEIKSGYGLDLESERKILEVAIELAKVCDIDVTTTFLGAHTVPPEFKSDPDSYVQYVCETMLPALHAEGLINCVDVYCEHIAFNLAQTERIFQQAKNLNLRIKIHAEQLSHMGGAKLAARYGAVSCDHLEFAKPSDVKAMAKAGCTAVLLPTAFYFLQQTQKPPIALLRKYGVPMAVATDANPGSSPTNSLLLAINMACTQFNLTPEEALLGVTRCAAQALGLSEHVGTISVGKKAHLVLWDIKHPNELAYYLGINRVYKVVKNGEVVLT